MFSCSVRELAFCHVFLGDYVVLKYEGYLKSDIPFFSQTFMANCTANSLYIYASNILFLLDVLHKG